MPGTSFQSLKRNRHELKIFAIFQMEVGYKGTTD